jgi:hypothetical protein
MEARIAGIPCKVRVTHCFVQKPLGTRCDSDLDCYGYTDIEFDVFDRNGRAAPWLEKKMSDDDRARIEELILQETADEWC